MRDTIAYERSGGARSGGRRREADGRAQLAGIRRFISALCEEFRRIPEYYDRAETLRQGLRDAHSNRRERERSASRT